MGAGASTKAASRDDLNSDAISNDNIILMKDGKSDALLDSGIEEDTLLTRSLAAIISSRQIGATRSDLLPLSSFLSSTNQATMVLSGEVEVRSDRLLWVNHSFVLSGTSLYLWKNENGEHEEIHSKTPTAVYQLSYAKMDTFSQSTIAKIPKIHLAKLEAEVGQDRIRVYHPRGVIFVRPIKNAATNIDMWESSINNMMANAFTAKELDLKKQAAEKLEPYLCQQFLDQFEKTSFIMDRLADQGFVITPDDPLTSISKIKGGNLKVQIEDYILMADERVQTSEYYCIILPDGVYWYQKGQSTKEFSGCLSCKNVEVDCDLSSMEFSVTTPLRTISFVGRDVYDVREWIIAIGKGCSGRNNIDEWVKRITLKIESEQELNRGAEKGENITPITTNKKGETTCHIHLLKHYTKTTQHQKSYKVTLSPGENSIGRDPSNMHCIADERASRFHCRVYIDTKGLATVVDLNSSRGVTLNGKKVVNIGNVGKGDVLTVGHTDFTFE